MILTIKHVAETIEHTGEEYQHTLEVYAGPVKLGEITANVDGFITWENYADRRKEYNLLKVENGIIDDNIYEL